MPAVGRQRNFVWYRGNVLPIPRDPQASLLAAWRTNNRVTVQFIERLPPALGDLSVPGSPRRTIRAIAAHLHNARCSWVETLGREHGITAPTRVDHHRITPRALGAALKRSSAGIEALLKLGFAAEGQVPPSKGYVWRNLSLDVGHVLTYGLQRLHNSRRRPSNLCSTGAARKSVDGNREVETLCSSRFIP